MDIRTKRLMWGTNSLLDRVTASILKQQQRFNKDVYENLWEKENKIVTGDMHERLAHGLISEYRYQFLFSSYTGYCRNFLAQESEEKHGQRRLTLTQKLKKEIRFHRSEAAAVDAIKSAAFYDYLRPYEINFPVIDSFTKVELGKKKEVHGVGFQMTIAKKHKSDTKKQEFAAILKQCRIKVLHLIWIPYPGSYSTWPSQPIKVTGITVHQYRMDITDFLSPSIKTS